MGFYHDILQQSFSCYFLFHFLLFMFVGASEGQRLCAGHGHTVSDIAGDNTPVPSSESFDFLLRGIT